MAKISLCTLCSPRQHVCPASLSKPQALEGAQLSSGFAGPAWCCGQREGIALASQNGLTGLVRWCSYKQSHELVQISLDPCFSQPPAFLMPGAAPRRGPAPSLGEETLRRALSCCCGCSALAAMFLGSRGILGLLFSEQFPLSLMGGRAEI